MSQLAKIRVPKFLREAFLDLALIVVIKAGRRTGKTYNWVIWLIVMLDREPDKAGLWVDTKHSNIDKYVERYFRPILTKMNHWKDCNYNQQKKILTLHNGSYIDFGSAERPEMMEGFGYDYAVINEGGIVFKKPSLWENTLYPMIKHAIVRIIGTPKGKNTFESLYHRYKHYSFNCYDSPFWTEQEIQNAKETMTEEAFRQEMLADFIEGAGAVFRRINDNIAGKLLDGPVEGRRYVLGADLAKHSDFTVIFIADADSRQIVYHERFNQIDWGLQKARIINAYQKFGCTSGVIDATGVGDAVFDDLQNAGLNLEGFKFTSTTKQELVSNLSVAMDNGNISYPHIPELIDELEIFAYEQRANGNFIYSAPEGFHDDEVMALGLVNRAIGMRVPEYGGVIFA
ncbi:terminase large subunit domain-containing protein [Streptomyces sp. BBFR109]|uniref:phage terminase large subunit family protein n=1 Tax=Streptomyces sp. BBFR109 TaxID=3448172 RepID=UPI003F774F12